MMKVLESSPTTQYTLSMKRSGRYIGIIDGRRYWRGLDCGHPVPNYATRRCMNCWNLDRSAALTGIKKNVAIRGEKHHSWKGGRVYNKHSGYISVKEYNHPKSNNGYVLEHRLVMEKHIGRYLEKGEEVHHINHDKLDNSIENLMLFSSHSDHIKYEHRNGERKI